MKVGRVNANGQNIEIGDFVLLPSSSSRMPRLAVVRAFSDIGNVLGFGLRMYIDEVEVVKVSTNFSTFRNPAYLQVIKLSGDIDLKCFLPRHQHSKIHLLHDVSKEIKDRLLVEIQ